MNTRDYVRFISKLNRETKEKKIEWQKSTSPIKSLIGSETIIDFVYTTNVVDKMVRLFKFKEKHYYDEDIYDWVENYRLEFIDISGNSIYTLPDDRSIPDLYETVRFKTSGIESFFDSYLSDDE
jgi:hypothetical protein